MYKITIITHPISDVEGEHFKEIEVDADRYTAYAETVIFYKEEEIVLRAPVCAIMIEKGG